MVLNDALHKHSPTEQLSWTQDKDASYFLYKAVNICI